jgi:hypothetical protein
MSATQLASLAGIVLSLVFSYFPGLKTWYDGLDSAAKSLVMAIAVVVVGVAAFGLSCWPAFPWPVFTCDMPGFWGMAAAVVAALVTNQSTYVITRKLKKSTS